jgi:hypothetical protein
MKKNILINMFAIIVAFSSCNQLKLDNVEAGDLVKKTLELPKKYREDIGLGFGATSWLDALQNDGLITYNIEYSGPWNTYLYLNPTDKGKPFYLGQDPKNSNIHRFLTNNIDFENYGNFY